VIIDGLAPGKGAYSLVSAIKKNASSRPVPTIMIMDPGRESDRKAAASAGCDDIIYSPVRKVDVALRVGVAARVVSAMGSMEDREKFDLLINGMQDALVVLDRDLNAVIANTRAADILEIRPDGAAFAFFPEISRRFKIAYDGDLRSDMLAGPVTFDIERPEKRLVKPLVLEAHSSVIKSPIKGPDKVLLILTDVTARRAEAAIKQNFLGLVSHKLRTPIAAAGGFASLLRDGALGPLTEKQKSALRTINDSLAKLNDLVDKMIGFATLENRYIDTAGEDIVLSDYLSGLCASFRSRYAGVDMRLAVGPGADKASMAVKKGHLDLIMKNLLDNAVKFGGKKVAISLGIEKTPQAVIIKVRDNGPGIPPEERARVFDKFYQIEKDFTGNVEGAGLGLAIVKKLVEAYGGNVRLDSKIGRGTCFTVSFPADKKGVR
jgi:signal transduction histidine kinase